MRVRDQAIYTNSIGNGRNGGTLNGMTVSTNLNGIDLAAVGAVTERLRRTPGVAPRFAASVRWLGGYRTEARVGPEEALAGDEPVALAGTNTGPSPEDLLLGAVGQCLIVGLAGLAAKRGVAIRSLSVDVDGDVNLPAAYGIADGHPGFQAIRIAVQLDADANRLELEALVDHALAHAPIPSTVSNPVPVTATLVSSPQG
jgi:uncharacterized OsmC-like protein